MKTIQVMMLTVLTMTLEAAPKSSIVQGTDEFDLTYRIEVPALDRSGRLWVPIAISDAFQKVTLRQVAPPLERTTDEVNYSNKVGFCELAPSTAPRVIELTYHVKRSEKQPYITAETNLSRFLGPDRLVPVDEKFRKIAVETAGAQPTTVAKAHALYEHVLKRMSYDKSGTNWGRGDAIYACDVGTGNCSDFHAYFIALARSIGIPARFAIGLSIPAGESTGKIAGYHCWAEFRSGDRWIPVDISEAWKEPALKEYYFGHHPANRFEISRGRDLRLEPAPKSGLVNFFVYPLLEVDGQPVTAKTEFQFHRTS